MGVAYDDNIINTCFDRNLWNLFKLEDIECERKDIKESDEIVFSPVTGIVEQIDSNNTEIIIRSFDNTRVFVYLEDPIDNQVHIERLVKEGDYILSGQPILSANKITNGNILNKVIIILKDNGAINNN